jgi:hypothetical protein
MFAPANAPMSAWFVRTHSVSESGTLGWTAKMRTLVVPVESAQQPHLMTADAEVAGELRCAAALPRRGALA